ncbi:ABC transporter permease [Streptomyces sp. NPDC026589]|uniref:ABC transporter permease n=1 Tax=Streptomyces sp. NPDC026589 TaxID=3155609 RepID=UPI0033E243AD
MRGPLRWLARRLVLAVLVVGGAATVAFAGMELTPGDPVRTLLGTSPATPEMVARVRADLGYDEPLVVRYGRFVGRLLSGDLGVSYQLQEPVGQVLATQFWPTVQLTLAGFTLGLAGALVLAVATSERPGTSRRLSALFELVAVSAPGFWTGGLLLGLFSFHLRIFPAAGDTGPASLVLPAVTMALSVVGTFAQVLRDAMERALTQPFALSARARGTGELGLRVHHALRHGLVPLTTLSGWTIGALLSGAVVIETIFSRPGLGRVLAAAITSRDLPVVTGVVVVAAAAFSLLSILVDWLYRVIDPRLRSTGP